MRRGLVLSGRILQQHGRRRMTGGPAAGSTSSAASSATTTPVRRGLQYYTYKRAPKNPLAKFLKEAFMGE